MTIDNASAAKTPRGLGVRPQPPPTYHPVDFAAGAPKSDRLLGSPPDTHGCCLRDVLDDGGVVAVRYESSVLRA